MKPDGGLDGMSAHCQSSWSHANTRQCQDAHFKAWTVRDGCAAAQKVVLLAV